jgi:hypothetical protein
LQHFTFHLKPYFPIVNHPETQIAAPRAAIPNSMIDPLLFSQDSQTSTRARRRLRTVLNYPFSQASPPTDAAPRHFPNYLIGDSASFAVIEFEKEDHRS